MKKYIVFLGLGFASFLQACSENSTAQLELKLQVPPQLRSVNYNQMMADVLIGSGPPQRVTFNSSSAKTLTISSIVPNQTYDYEVSWFEIIDGVELQLSSQTGELLVSESAPTANLNADHDTDYDADNDQIENLTERRNGDCPWVSCDESGNLVDLKDVVIVSMSNGGTITYTGSGQWAETIVNEAGQHNYDTTQITRSSIFLEDVNRCNVCESPFRGYLIEIDLSQGDINFSYNEQDDAYFKIYDVVDVE